MFIGHFALGLAAGRMEKRLPLGTAVVASQLPDAIWPYLLLTGVEKVTIAPGDTAMTPLRFDSYPWSHSLLMVAITGLLAAKLQGADYGEGFWSQQALGLRRLVAALTPQASSARTGA